MPTHVAAAVTLEQPLPREITGSRRGWFTRYQNYPVFSRTWSLGRFRIWLLAMVALALVLTLATSMSVGVAPRVPASKLVYLAIELGLPLLLGSVLGLWVRRRGWATTLEWRALIGAVAATVVACALFAQFLGVPTKRFLAGMLGESIEANQPDVLAIALFSFWLAGGLALWSYRRERLELQQLLDAKAVAAANRARLDAEARLSVLAAQVEPHFLFNSLAGVRSAIATDPGRATAIVEALADYLRLTIPKLRDGRAASSTLGVQFELAESYLRVMRARVPRMSYAMHLPDDLAAQRFPPLMLISLAENAVKHGVERKAGPVHVALEASAAGVGPVSVSVSDDGPGLGDAEGGSGIGLANIRSRLAELYGSAASLSLRENKAGGVTATITLPRESAAGVPTPAAG
ncbi:MAG: sensor histidine kinase [Caldimonas sp.]